MESCGKKNEDLKTFQDFSTVDSQLRADVLLRIIKMLSIQPKDTHYSGFLSKESWAKLSIFTTYL